MFRELARKLSAHWGHSGPPPWSEATAAIAARRAELEPYSDARLQDLARKRNQDRTECFAVAAIAAERTLGLRPFDVQIQGALAMADGRIVEMQTGEGKTLAAVLAVAWYVAQESRVHVLTANDYLAGRDAQWMKPVYDYLGISVASISQSSTASERRAAYGCEVTYATPQEAGFDYLRDGLALTPQELVHRDLAVALIDEADSILIDEARIPLIIAGGKMPPAALVGRLAVLARSMRRHYDFATDQGGHNVILTDRGAARIEAALGCGSIYDERNLELYSAVCNALHAEALLRRDVDYLVRGGAIHLVDEFKGRVAESRRWPAGLQTALEAKEGLKLQEQGRILGAITMQSYIKLYERICGMTGTAETQRREFHEVYGLEVEVIPTNKPVIRVDQPDVIVHSAAHRDQMVIDEIVRWHNAGRPVLVGTASVSDSERLSEKLQRHNIPHKVLNARNDAEEAGIIAKAGERGAVTISTNMAGRGTDIRLGEGVAESGGLYVIGTARHEARRIDHQLRGRAGRQGDPGESRFFLSLQDDLMQRYHLAAVLPQFGDQTGDAMDHIQRVIEGEMLDIRKTLWKYDRLIEAQRQVVYEMRLQVLLGEQECDNPRAALFAIDELWADYLAEIAEIKSGIHWISFGGKNPFDAFLQQAKDLFATIRGEMEAAIVEPPQPAEGEEFTRGATWTYVTTDEPLGDMNQRMSRAIAKLMGLGRK